MPLGSGVSLNVKGLRIYLKISLIISLIPVESRLSSLVSEGSRDGDGDLEGLDKGAFSYFLVTFLFLNVGFRGASSSIEVIITLAI